ncbi:hypothetical protein BCR34DRAFT_493170 [Clohesyomyces aquaticus]|uniref:Coenzyme Q-binding protein COQ10 START domain-containing protein n=1 Tax=Clohesyomyces aquaticus TaxID=1231657 RepID=A0A1Y1YY30_9PLEO|nr:hypothetical protein BCR34DRAFT_493170 [Clohesyomyces aquaticus]
MVPPISGCLITLLVVVVLLTSHAVTSQTSNLPDAPPGVFTASTSIEINTTLSAAWSRLTDFPNYSDWNPFVRSAIITTPSNINLTHPIPLPVQSPIEDHWLIFRVQIPPLPLPVSAYTVDNPLHTQFALENITHVQPQLGRLAWRYMAPKSFLESERWQAISGLEGGGGVLYESREVFHGAGAEVLRSLYGEGLREGFEGQARGLKMVLEGR